MTRSVLGLLSMVFVCYYYISFGPDAQNFIRVHGCKLVILKVPSESF
jgi:hypothetical protein